MEENDQEVDQISEDNKSVSKNGSTSKYTFSIEEDSEAHKSKSNGFKDEQQFSWYWAIFVLLFGCLVYYLIHYNDYILPKVITKDDIKLDQTLFSGESSKDFLKKIVALGPRTFGSPTAQILTPNLLKSEINDLISKAHPSHSINIETQIGGGGIRYEGKIPYSSLYEDVINVIVIFKGTEGNHSILINAHYDTVPETEGASDDGLSCAVMLEMIRALSSDVKRYQHNIIFLFNEAEEVDLMGSHLFLQHKLSKNVKAFINLESAGSGGRAIMFRSSPRSSWLFKYYIKNAPHTHGLVLNEDLFFLVPSETDFIIFTTIGNIPGLDVAFSRNGYVYHTKYDREEYLLTENHQYMGENYLAVIRALGDAQEFYNNNISDGEVIYYDYLGWFMISYSHNTAIALNVIIIILVIFSIIVFIGRLMKWRWIITATEYNLIENIFKKCKRNNNTPLVEFGIFTGARLLGMLSATVVNIIVCFIVNAAAYLKMPWFSNVWLIFPIYWCPCLVVYSLVPILIEKLRVKRINLPLSTTCQMSILAAQVPFILLFIITTCVGFKSSSMLFLPMLTAAIGNLITHLTPLCYSTQKWIWVHLILHIPATLMSMYTMLLLYAVLIPVLGRSGAENSDLKIAIASSLFCFLTTYFLVPLMLMAKRSRLIYITLSTFSIFMIIISLTTKVGHPYRAGPTDPTPQRYWIMHTTREFTNETGHIRRFESGYVIDNWDANGPQTIPESQRKDLVSLEEDCLKEHYCGVPHYFPRTVLFGPKNSWIPAAPPIQPIQTEINLKERNCNQSTLVCTLTFILKGPDRMTLTFASKNGAHLIKWNLPTNLALSDVRNGMAHYFINIARGDVTKEYKVILTFEVTLEQLNGAPIIDLGLSGHNVYHENSRTEAYKAFLESFPIWTDVMGWISVYKSFVY